MQYVIHYQLDKGPSCTALITAPSTLLASDLFNAWVRSSAPKHSYCSRSRPFPYLPPSVTLEHDHVTTHQAHDPLCQPVL